MFGQNMNNGPAAPGADIPDDAVREGPPLPTRNFLATRRRLVFLLALSVLVPVVCLSGYGYYDYQRRYSDAVAISERAARVAEEQALKVMDLNTELVSRVEDLLGEMPDHKVRGNEAAIHERLNVFVGGFPQVAAISAFGGSGDLLVSSRFFPVPSVNVAKRDDFIAARNYRPEQYISKPMKASVSGARVFNTAKARTAADGKFLGTVSVALRRDYFVGFYQKLMQEEGEAFVGLHRQDGALLASYPDTGVAAGTLTSSALTDAFARNERAGHIRTDRFADKEQRFIAYRRVGQYRLFVTAGFLSHELFGGWLMAVKSNMALARNKGFRDVEDQVNAVERATHHVEALVRTLMGATKKQPLQLAQIDLAAVLPQLTPVVRTVVGDSVSVSVDPSPGLWPVRCDPAELEVAIINLAINARDAMPQGGKFAVRAQNVEVASHVVGVPAGNYVLVTASDDGAGMTAAVAERAFEPLFTTKRNNSAAGLGLTQVQSFCELSGGTAKITSSPGVGTTLRLYLPKSAARELEVTNLTPKASAAAHEPVLLVEDNQEVAEGLAAVLQVMGHHVTDFGNADEALVALKSGERFKLVLSDVQMPGKLNGIDLAEWMKANRPDQPVALMTGYADELERARLTGVPIFAKPFAAEELAPLIS
ncbi:hybrid sensor histidine kinase/response regulator [Paraburkholderia hospita]|nr:hybrid sensor histidine kinase/response regulator [Paraburkholderia hospita]